MLKDLIKKIAGNKLKSFKANLKKKIIFTVVPIFLLILLPVVAVEYILSPEINPNLSDEENKELEQYIEDEVKDCTPETKDYFEQDQMRTLQPQYVKNFFKFLMQHGYIKERCYNLNELKVLSEYVVDELKSEFKYKTMEIKTVITYETKEKLDELTILVMKRSNPKWKESDFYKWVPHKETSSKKIKVLVDSDTIYCHETFTYENKSTETTEPDTDKRRKYKKVTTQPVITNTTQGPAYEKLKRILKQYGITKKDDVNYAINCIINTSDSWLMTNGDPDQVSFGGGWSNLGDVTAMAGVPKDLIPYFNKAAKVSGVPSWFLAGTAKNESDFDIHSKSSCAHGIMQFNMHYWNSTYAEGMKAFLDQAGIKTSSAADARQKFENSAEIQILCGAYELRYYANLVLYNQGKVSKLEYLSTANMAKVNWNAKDGDATLKEFMERTSAGYNAGPRGCKYSSLDTCLGGYPRKVYEDSMIYRKNSLGGTSAGKGADDKIVKCAEKYLGVPYVWGGTSPSGFDCSGFVQYVYKQTYSIDIGRTTYDQIRKGNKVDKNSLKPGDLVFMDTNHSNSPTHVVMYIGNGMIIHAPRTGKTIEEVSLDSCKSWAKILQFRRYV